MYCSTDVYNLAQILGEGGDRRLTLHVSMFHLQSESENFLFIIFYSQTCLLLLLLINP